MESYTSSHIKALRRCRYPTQEGCWTDWCWNFVRAKSCNLPIFSKYTSPADSSTLFALTRGPVASAFPLHVERTLPSPGAEVMPMRVSEPVIRTDPAGVPVPGIVRNRRGTGLGLPLRLLMLLDIRK